MTDSSVSARLMIADHRTYDAVVARTRLLRPLLAAVILSTASPAGAQEAAPALSGPVSIGLDHAGVFAIPTDTQLMIVGNPAIADVTKPAKAANVAVLTGKSLGQTNVVLVDGEGRVLGAALVRVEAARAPLVTVQRGADSRQTYACTPNCAPAAALGDSFEAFRGIADEMQMRQSLSSPWAGGASPLLPGTAPAR